MERLRKAPCLSILALIASCSGPVSPEITPRSYTPAREQEIINQFNALNETQAACANGFIKSYQKALFDHCEATNGGKNIGGGCDHVAYFGSVHTRVLEVALERCTKTN